MRCDCCEASCTDCYPTTAVMSPGNLTGSHSTIILQDAKGRFLLGYHPKKTERPWRFPGGRIEPGESPLVAAARELKEEVGIEARSLELIHTATQDVDGGRWKGYYFACNHYVGTPTICEHDKVPVLWSFNIEDLHEMLSTPELHAAYYVYGARELADADAI